LGGYRSPARNGEYLVHEQPDVESQRARPLGERYHKEYAVFWPGRDEPLDTKWREGGNTMGWVDAQLEPTSGSLEVGGAVPNGWVYKIEPEDATESPSAFPDKCPCCGAD